MVQRGARPETGRKATRLGFGLVAVGQGVVAAQNLQPGEWDVAALAALATVAAVGAAVAVPPRGGAWRAFAWWVVAAAVVQLLWVARSVSRGNPGFYVYAMLLLVAYGGVAWVAWRGDAATAGRGGRAAALFAMGAVGFVGMGAWRLGGGFPWGAAGAFVAAAGLALASWGWFAFVRAPARRSAGAA